jgi:CRP-like cAMP-binding protein
MLTIPCDNCIVFTKSFFSSLAGEDLAELNEHKKCTLYKKNHTVFTAGTRPNGIYCLMQGKIKIYKTGAEGRQQIIRLVNPGEFFGLRTAITDDYYTATAVAVEESKVCIIGKETFRHLLDHNPQFTNFIIAFLCDRLDDANGKLISMALKPVRERLAETLVILGDMNRKSNAISPEQEAEINLSREDMANLIGTATESVIRLLSEFKSDNLIAIKGRKVTLLDEAGLKRIARI